MAELIQGDALTVLRGMPAESVHCCVTSPPYYGLRDYGMTEQIGLEKTPDEYVEKLVDVFREVRRVLRNDGTLWLNLGDAYSWGVQSGDCFVPSKNLLGIPWRVAFALQADGWILRQDIIWHKPNPMPESVRDRCTKAHEYLFLLSKQARYYYDREAVREEPKPHNAGKMRAPKCGPNRPKYDSLASNSGNVSEKKYDEIKGANRRSVWTVNTKPYSGAHFATFPPDLIEPCILAGCPEGGTVLDPFGGAGTTAVVAYNMHRRSILIDLNPEYIDLAQRRIDDATSQTRLFDD
jgi:site-specific DNA-methyltransferase (adenine-specific)